MDFLPFDPDAEFSRRRRRLPHWFQDGRTYFVTFRLADSIPRTKRDAIRAEQREWLEARGVEDVDQLAEADRIRYRNRFTKQIEALLDKGYGDCVLRDPENAQLVGDALEFFDGERYDLDVFVVMPNHVHLLVCPIVPNRLSRLLQSWKRHTAREINRRLGRTGQPLWLDENFDHIVRSGEQLEHFRSYIFENPGKAGLRVGEYLLKCGADL